MSNDRFGVGGQGGQLGDSYDALYLDMLVDVKIGTPTNQYVLTYNSATNVWEPQPAGAGADTKTFVFENGVQVGTVSRYVNFNGGDFNVTENAGSDWFLIELASGAVAAHDLTGASHTEDATGGAGNVLRASGATAFAWAQLGHGDLGSVTSDQHHAQQHTLSGADHTGDLIYTQVDAIVDIAGVGANNLLSRADHVHTDLDGSSKITYSNLSSIPSTFDPVAHDLTSAYHTDSGLTTGHFLKATGLTTFAWQAHGLGASDVGAYTTAQTDTAIDTDITTHAGIATAHQDAPGLIATHAAIATAHQDAPGLIATHAAISGAHHAQGHVLSGTDHTATGLTVGWVISADSATTFSWKAPTGGSDADAIHDNVADEINQIADKASPVGADVLIIEDSAGAGWTKKKVSITNLPGGADADAIHDNVSNEIQVITPKASPAGADVIIIEDSASTWAKKSVLISNLPAGSPSFGLPVSIDIGDAQAEGTSGDSARADHQHAFAAPGVGYPLDVAAAESDGVATTVARSDHVHAHGTGYSANAHHNQAHVLSGGDHTASGLTVGHAIMADTATTFSWQMPSYYNSFTTDFAAESLANLTTRTHASLSDAPTDAHHNEAHVLATIGPHTGTLPLADLAVGSQGSIIRRGAIDWEELVLSTLNYALVCTATDASWAQYDYSWLANIPSTFAPSAHGSSAHSGAIFAGANDSFGAFYLDIDDIAVPIDPAVSVRRLFVDTATGKLSVRTNASTTVSLEEQGGSDADAIHDNVSDEIHVITAKGAPVGADVIIIEDSAGAAWTKKSVLISNLPAGSPSFGAPTGNIDIGDAAVEGTSGDSTRADHQHAFTAPGAGYPQDIAAAESDGVATTAARSDHVHAHGTGYSADAHHAQAHALATTGDHTGELPLADLAAGTQGGIIRRGAADWEEFARGTQYKYLRAGASDVEWQARKFSITACIISPEVGYKTVWRAPFACTCVEIQGRQKGGTSTVINARYNGTTDVATADLTLTAADTWYNTTGINQTAWAVDSWLEVEVVTVGSATEVTIQVEFTEP